MPLSMLIVHCSKAAFIKMIKHSQTTAKYLKASGHGTWQVTTTRTNSSHFPSSQSSLPLQMGLRTIVSCRLVSHEPPNEKLSAGKAATELTPHARKQREHACISIRANRAAFNPHKTQVPLQPQLSSASSSSAIPNSVHTYMHTQTHAHPRRKRLLSAKRNQRLHTAITAQPSDSDWQLRWQRDFRSSVHKVSAIILIGWRRCYLVFSFSFIRTQCSITVNIIFSCETFQWKWRPFYATKSLISPYFLVKKKVP